MDYLVGLIIGAVLGLTGAGGSVFAVPLLVYLIHLTPQNAVGISLGAVGVSALVGVLVRLRLKEIQWLPAIVFALIGSLFTPVGLYLNKQVDPAILMLGFSVLVAGIAVRLWRQALVSPEQTQIVRSSFATQCSDTSVLCRANNNEPFRIGFPCVIAISGGAVATGVLSGLFGVGGGFLIVPTLLFLTNISMKKAVATSLFVICVISLTGFVSYIVSHNTLDLPLLSHVALGGVAGMSIGVLFSRFIAGPALQKIFAVLMLVMAVITVFMSVTS